MKNWHGMQGAQRLLLFQFGVAMLISIVALLKNDTQAAFSAIIGGLVCVMPNIFFVRKIFKYNGARAAKQIVNGFYKGEALKLIMSIALFVLVFNVLQINPLVFFATYIAAQMVFWFAPLIIVNKHK